MEHDKTVASAKARETFYAREYFFFVLIKKLFLDIPNYYGYCLTASRQRR